MNKENTKDTEASFLDTNITIKGKKFITSLYDKRDAFNCQIVNYPDLSGNIPKRTSYGVYISQILRYSIACMDYSDFVKRSQMLSKKLIQQHYEKHRLKNTLRKTFVRYPNIPSKYDVNSDSIVCDLFT